MMTLKKETIAHNGVTCDNDVIFLKNSCVLITAEMCFYDLFIKQTNSKN